MNKVIKPAISKNIYIETDEWSIYFEVYKDDLTIVMGKKRLNSKLREHIMNWCLVINKENIPALEDYEIN